MIPAYIQIHDTIKKDIENGTWKIGQRLPSERDLSEIFQVSRMTLRQAVTLLVEEGILERRVGSGTFVTSHRVQERMRGTTSFTEIIKSQGKVPSSKLISYTKTHPNKQEIQQLQLNPRESIIRMERVRYADNLPVVYEIAAIPEKIIKPFKKEDIVEHFFQTLTEHGHEIGKSRQIISASLASDAVAQYLKIASDSAVLTLLQVSYFSDNRPFEFVRSQYVGERFEFYLENN